MQQGQLALDRKASAMGGRVSGAALKEAAQFGTNYAASGYGAAYQRRQDRLNRLAALAGVGQTATAGTAQAGANAVGGIASAIGQQGDASAAARLAQGNIWGNATNQIGAMASRWVRAPSASTSFGGPLDSFFSGTGGSGD
jgi:hypothetical protein